LVLFYSAIAYSTNINKKGEYMRVDYFASESVCEGHPDKLCDQISDAILDAILTQDPLAHVGVEAMASANKLILAGEVKTSALVDYEAVARAEIRRIGYIIKSWGFHHDCNIEVMIHQQSPEINAGVQEDEGAGDQGMMFGFACDQTPELMPMPIAIAHELTRKLDDLSRSNAIFYPDGKAQVVVRYENGVPKGIEHVTIAKPYNRNVSYSDAKKKIYETVVAPVLDKYGFSIEQSEVILNGTGEWYTPGPYSDAGLTGRKIVVDGYGGYARVGGGAFSGKDPSKVDRSGAYAARYIAKNLVANGFTKAVEVGLAYYIGAKQPVMLTIETKDGHRATSAMYAYAVQLIDPSVKGIIETLGLRRPIYQQTACYGHFGRDFPWEQVV